MSVAVAIIRMKFNEICSVNLDDAHKLYENLVDRSCGPVNKNTCEKLCVGDMNESVLLFNESVSRTVNESVLSTVNESVLQLSSTVRTVNESVTFIVKNSVVYSTTNLL